MVLATKSLEIRLTTASPERCLPGVSPKLPPGEFPEKFFNAIFDHVDAVEDLLSLSLCNRYWHGRWRTCGGEASLYRNVSTHGFERLARFARSIFARPELASRVRHLSITAWNISDSDAKERNVWVEYLKMRQAATSEVMHLLGPWEDGSSVRIVCVLLAYMSHMEHFTTDYSFQHPILRRSLGRAIHVGFAQTCTWTSLARITLSSGPEEHLELNDLREVFLLPWLRNLHASHVSAVSVPFERLGPGSSGITDLALLRSHLQPDDFEEIFRATYPLTRLRFDYKPLTLQPPSAGLAHALAHVCETLTDLHIGFPHGGSLSAQDCVGRLEHLKNLRTLVLAIPDTKEAPFDTWPVKRLDLPNSLTTVTVCCAWKVEAADPALADFVHCALALPRVRRIALREVYAKWHEPFTRPTHPRARRSEGCRYMGRFPMTIRPAGHVLRHRPAAALRDLAKRAEKRGVELVFDELEGDSVGVWLSEEYTGWYTLRFDEDPFGHSMVQRRVDGESYWKPATLFEY